MTFQLIELSVENEIATLRLNRPEKRNAMSDAMRSEFIEALEMVAADKAIRALVLTGNGKGFCAGGDITGMEKRMKAPAGEVAFNGWHRQQRVHHAVSLLHTMPKPTIAAVNGPAITGGLEIVLACDFVVASHEAKFADTHVHVGLLPGWGGSVRMIERVGLARAKELAFTGQFFNAEDAYQWGLVNHLVQPADLLPFCQNLACQMLKADPVHLKTYKALLDQEAQLILGSALAHEQDKAKEVNSHSSLVQIKNRLKKFTQSKN